MLIIFDCDGVLVDSEQLAAEVFSNELRRNGTAWTADECHRQFRGYTLRHCLELLNRSLAEPLPSDFLEKLQEATRLAFESSLKAVEGVAPVLELLQSRGIPFCVASNGSYEKMEHALRVTGLYPYFENRCYSAEAVAQGKPAPDLFLLAAESLGVNPRFCHVIEDSAAGMHAAAAAGMRALYYNPLEQTTESDCIAFNSMRQLPQLLGIDKSATCVAGR